MREAISMSGEATVGSGTPQMNSLQRQCRNDDEQRSKAVAMNVQELRLPRRTAYHLKEELIFQYAQQPCIIVQSTLSYIEAAISWASSALRASISSVQLSPSQVITSTEQFLSLRLELRELSNMFITWVMILKFKEFFTVRRGAFDFYVQ